MDFSPLFQEETCLFHHITKIFRLLILSILNQNHFVLKVLLSKPLTSFSSFINRIPGPPHLCYPGISRHVLLSG